MILETRIGKRFEVLGILLFCGFLTGCNTTSGSSRLDATGEQIGENIDDTGQPETPAFYIQALKGGLVSKIPGIKLSSSNRSRALEAEYKALETAPGGQNVVWESGNTKGMVVAAVPYQVGSQNCRQYTHSVSVNGALAQTARGAACRNANGSWTPLT